MCLYPRRSSEISQIKTSQIVFIQILPGRPKDLDVRKTWKSKRPGLPGTWSGCLGTWMSGDLDVRGHGCQETWMSGTQMSVCQSRNHQARETVYRRELANLSNTFHSILPWRPGSMTAIMARIQATMVWVGNTRHNCFTFNSDGEK